MISKRKLAQIHVAKAQLGLSDDDYRAILARTAGVSSAKELTERTVGGVLHEFRRLGWQPKAPKRAGRVPNTFNKHEQLAKIEALLTEMALSWEYAGAIAKRQTGIDRIDWLRTEAQFRGVIAALEPFVLLQADVTDNDADDKELLQYFSSFGPPTIAFFDAAGQEQPAYKLVGFVSPEDFAAHVQRLAAL